MAATIEHDEPLSQAPDRRRRRRRRRMIIASLAFALVVASGLGGYHLWSTRSAGPASVSDAVARYRAGRHGAPSATQRAALPIAGVYRFRGAGTERLSVLHTTQHQGPDVPVTVVIGPGKCFTFKVEYNNHHWQAWHWCRHGTLIVEDTVRSHQAFDFAAFSIDDLTLSRCSPPVVIGQGDVAPGQSWSGTCVEHSQSLSGRSTSTARITFRGSAVLRVAGRVVRTRRYREEWETVGTVHGRSRTDLWVDATTGMPLREVRTVHVESPAPAPLHHVQYDEDGHFEIVTLEPLR